MTTVEELTVEVEDLRQKNERLQRINAVRLAKFDLIRSELQYYIMGNSEKDELIGELQASTMLFIAKDIYDRVLNYSKPGFNKDGQPIIILDPIFFENIKSNFFLSEP